MTKEYRVELYRDNEGSEPDTWHLVEYRDGVMAGSAIGAITTDKQFAEAMAKVINHALDALSIIASFSKHMTDPKLSSEDSWGNYDDVFYDGMAQAEFAAASVAKRVLDN